MFNKSSIKGFLVGTIVTSIVSTAAFVVFAEPLEQTINVLYDDIKIIVDGIEKIPPSDMKPFVYNGRTYVSLRFAGEALGKKVGWDGDTKKIFISDTGETVKELKEIFLYKKPYMETNSLDNLRTSEYQDKNASYKDIFFDNASAYALSQNKKGSDGLYHSKYYITYALNGQAKTLYSTIGLSGNERDDYKTEGIFRIYNDSNKLLYESPIMRVSTDWIDINVDVSKALNVKLEVELRSVEGISSFLGDYNRVSPTMRNLRVLTTNY